MNTHYRLLCVALTLVFLLPALALTQEDSRDSYYLYTNWGPGIGYTTGINGYVDHAGDIEGMPGAEYIFVVGGPSYNGNHTAYVYRVETDGDPNQHPSNPDATGPIAPRTFTLVNSHYLGNFSDGHRDAFYIDETGIYYGADQGWAAVHGCGIYHWDFQWNPIGCEVPDPAPPNAQTLARNPATGDWWVTLSDRKVYRWRSSAWEYQFTHPNLSGSHSDGMEIIENLLFISDMTSDIIIAYRLDENGDVIDPPNTPFSTFTYSAGPHVEGMGYGPNSHIWISGWNSYTIYEIGGGCLQIWLDSIPSQTVFPGEAFVDFDLDDYVGCVEEPYSWSYEGNVDLSVGIDADNIVSISYPEGWTGSEVVTFILTDGQGRSVSRSAAFTVLPSLECSASISPSLIYFLWAYALDPMEGMCFIGDCSAGYEVSKIDPATVRINDSVPVTLQGIVADHPDFSGDALAVWFPFHDFILSYGPVWDTAEYVFTVTGECTDGAAFTCQGTTIIAGLLAGDANGDKEINVGDAVYIMTYIFRNGPAPVIEDAGNVNGDTVTNIGDVVYLIHYLFKDGPKPFHR